VVTFYGPGKGFLNEIRVSWGDNEYGHGTAGTSIRTRRPAILRDLLNNPSFSVWKDRLLRRDFAAAIGIPLIVEGEVHFVLVIYATEKEAFDTVEVELLEELGKNISHGILALRAQKERAAAMRALEEARGKLEERVSERTRELAARNEELSAEIERRKRAEETLRHSEEKYRELVENANSIILRMDRNGRITFFNEYAQKFFGYKEQEIIGQPVVGTIVPPEDSAGRDLARMITDIAETPDRYTRNENENMRRNGERVWVLWSNRPVVFPDGQVQETLCVGNDITELKRAEAALLRAKDAAEAADRVKSAFLATMSHELRTPLNSIIGFTSLLLKELAGPLNPEQRKQLGMVKNSGQHLLALINDVLDISKIEAEQLVLQAETFDVGQSIRKIVQTILPLAAKKELPISVQVADGVELLTTDQRRFEQVLMNLLSNAIKFTDCGEIQVACQRRDQYLETAVRDTGIGIKPEQQGEIFRPFRQLDTGLTRKHEGTGLGLSICKRLAGLMGGSIRFESTFGAGSTFVFTLPLRREEK
jgi:PAS domain S-box-containing protein